MIQVDSDTIGNAALIKAWIAAMEGAFRDTAEGKVEVPNRFHIDRGENTFLLMPCFGEKYFSTKLVVEGDTRFFKSVGMAAFDLYGAQLVYENLS